MPVDPKSLIALERIVDLKGTTKTEVLNEMIEAMATSPLVTDRDELRRKIFEREQTLSTGVGIGVALPHVKIKSVKDFVLTIGRCHRGVDFDALDGKPVHVLVMIGCNETQSGDFLKVMAKLVSRLKDDSLRRSILMAKSPEEIREIMIAAPLS